MQLQARILLSDFLPRVSMLTIYITGNGTFRSKMFRYILLKAKDIVVKFEY